LGLRRKARERAVQALYQLDGSGVRPGAAAVLEPAAPSLPDLPPPAAPAAPTKPAGELRWTLAGAVEPKLRKRGDSPRPAPVAAAVGPVEIRSSTIQETLHAFWASFDPPEPEVRKLAEPLITGVLEHLEELDGIVESSSLHWRVDRMARVDRNILRLGVYELSFRPEVPTKVCLNEAIEVARKYGAEDSGAFINGVLDRVAHSVRGPLADSSAESDAETGGENDGENDGPAEPPGDE
jgi:transcription antitermination protein NusB